MSDVIYGSLEILTVNAHFESRDPDMEQQSRPCQTWNNRQVIWPLSRLKCGSMSDKLLHASWLCNPPSWPTGEKKGKDRLDMLVGTTAKHSDQFERWALKQHEVKHSNEIVMGRSGGLICKTSNRYEFPRKDYCWAVSPWARLGEIDKWQGYYFDR